MVKVIKREDKEKQMSDDIRRLCLSLIAVLKREFPKDWQKILKEMVLE